VKFLYLKGSSWQQEISNGSKRQQKISFYLAALKESEQNALYR